MLEKKKIGKASLASLGDSDQHWKIFFFVLLQQETVIFMEICSAKDLRGYSWADLLGKETVWTLI